eukprot:ANDGO_01838.mRNA.1 FAD:protein FMN transferase
MRFDVFLSITPTPVDGFCPLESEMWKNAMEQVRVADDAGFEVAWFAESHLSHKAQLRNRHPVTPSFEGEIGLNSDFPQLATRVLSCTKRIGVGAAVLNILSNGGPIANAECIAQLISMHTALSSDPNREIHVAFSAGRFEYARRAFGVLPRNEYESIVWEELQPLVFREAMEVFVRLLRGDVLRADQIAPCILSAHEVADQAKWFSLQRALRLRDAKSDRAGQASPESNNPCSWCTDVRRIDEHQVQFPLRFIFPDQHIGVISRPQNASCLKLLVATHDPFLQRLANKWLPVQVCNLSVTPADVIDQTHELMKEAYHPAGGPWMREYMPRTVLVFLNADSSLTEVQQNDAAKKSALAALKSYWKAVEGTILDEDSPANNMRNAVWGCPAQVAAQLRNNYHADDRLMLWFDFFNHDSVAVCNSMKNFMRLVVPMLNDVIHPRILQSNACIAPNNNVNRNSNSTRTGSVEMLASGYSAAVKGTRKEIVVVIDLLPPIENADEASWTADWLRSSSAQDLEVRVFKGIDGIWPTEYDLAGCLAVVLTGSTCSCVNDYDHTEPLFKFFASVIRLEIPTLAICYSAQMLVRWIAGKEHVLRLPAPHVGFVQVSAMADRGFGRSATLFNSIGASLISTSAQSDGFIVPDENISYELQVGSSKQETRFIHTASAEKWKYQGFQLLGLPVWGVQFHPNWPCYGSETVFNLLQRGNPALVVERQGEFRDADQFSVGKSFLEACRHHVMLKWVVGIHLSGLTNLSTPSYVAPKDPSVTAAAEASRGDGSLWTRGYGDNDQGCVSLSGTSMKMAYRVMAVLPGYSSEAEATIRQIIESTFESIHSVANNFNAESEISKAIEHFRQGGEEIRISSLLERLLRSTFDAHLVTNRLFDPTVGSIKKLWKTQDGVPEDQRSSMMHTIGLGRWYVLRKEGCNAAVLSRKHAKSPQCALLDIDLCSIAKGFAVDLICERLLESGVVRYCVEWAGEIRVRGSDPSGRPWRTEIVRFLNSSSNRQSIVSDELFTTTSSVAAPLNASLNGAGKESPEARAAKRRRASGDSWEDVGSAQLTPMSVSDNRSFISFDLATLHPAQELALATSGTFYESLGKDRSHIIDPLSGEPVVVVRASPVCVTVVVSTEAGPLKGSYQHDACAWADAIATAAMTKSSAEETAMYLWNIMHRLPERYTHTLPPNLAILEFFVTSKSGRTFNRASVSDLVAVQTSRMVTSLPLPVCVLVARTPFSFAGNSNGTANNGATSNPSENTKSPRTNDPSNIGCLCTSAFFSSSGSFIVSLGISNRLCRLLTNADGIIVTDLIAYFLSPTQHNLAREILDSSSDSPILSDATCTLLHDGASRSCTVKLTASYPMGDHVVFVGFVQDQASGSDCRGDRDFLSYARKEYFTQSVFSNDSELPQPKSRVIQELTESTGSILGDQPIATGVCSVRPPIFYAMTTSKAGGWVNKKVTLSVQETDPEGFSTFGPLKSVDGIVSRVIHLPKQAALLMIDALRINGK